jgi:hypothetical protein
MSFFAHTSESRVRARRATVNGIGPEFAEVLASKGIDARDRAEQIRLNRAQKRSLAAQLRNPSRSERVTIPLAPGAVKASLDRSDVTQQQLLNEVAMESVEDDFINDIVAPVQLVDDRSGKVYVSSRTANRAEVSDELGRRASPNRIPSGLSSVEYKCETYGLASDIDEQLRGEHPLLENVARETRRLGSSVNLQQELRVVQGKLFTSGTYNASNRATLSSGYQWNGGTSANPISDMLTAVAAIKAAPTHAVMSLEVYQAIALNDELRAILSSTHEGLIDPDEFALYFGIMESIVNRGEYASAAAPTTMTRILSTASLALIHANSDPSMRTFLRQYRLRQGARGFVTSTWLDNDPGAAGFTKIKVAHDTHVVTVDDTYGYLLINVRQ